MTSIARSALVPVVAALLVASVLAGCSDEAPPPAADEARHDLPWAQQPITARITPVDVADDLAVIDSYVSTSAMRDLVARRDEVAVGCLVERGLDVELQLDGGGAAPSVDLGQIDVTREEFAATWGFGQVAPLQEDGGFQDEYTALSQQLSALPQDVPDPAGFVPDIALDPAAFQGPDSERVIVELYGAEALIQGSGNPPSPSGEPCRDIANDEVGLAEGTGPIAAAGELRAQARERVANDARIIELKATYQACMADQGFNDLASPWDAVRSIGAERDRLQAAAMEAVGPGEAPNAQSVGPDLVRQFQELGAREIAIATANVTCEGPYVEEVVPVSESIQQQVIDDNAALVAQLGGG